MRAPFLVVLLAVAAPAVGADATSPDMKAGEYVRAGDTGTLTLRDDPRKGRLFEIETVGANCHTCSISGTIEGSIGRTDDNPTCVVAFRPTRSGFEVEPRTEEACREYCGARAGFDGTYERPPAECTGQQQRITQGRFLELYRSRRYAEARDVLAKALSRCEAFIHWIEIDRMRNDLALAQLHAGDAGQCAATLEATLAAKHKSVEKLGEALPPCDATSYLEVAKSTWFNQALCAKAAAQKK